MIDVWATHKRRGGGFPAQDAMRLDTPRVDRWTNKLKTLPSHKPRMRVVNIKWLTENVRSMKYTQMTRILSNEM